MSRLHNTVIAILQTSDQPLGAYAIASEVAHRWGRVCHTNSVYRCLATLIAQKFAKRVVSRNAYMLEDPDKSPSLLLLCPQCGCAISARAPDLYRQILDVADAADFQVSETFLEVIGLCAACAKKGLTSQLSRQLRSHA
jgi:Fur family zinc uptake transcriptional regulator